MRSLSLVLFPLLLAACGDKTEVRDTATDDGGLDGEGTGGMPDQIDCEDVTTVLAAADTSPLGFSADEVLAIVAGPTLATATYPDGGATTGLSISLALVGDPVFHERTEVVDTGGGGADTGPAWGAPSGADGGCPDWLELPLSLRFVTDDGAFDESVSSTMLAMDLASLWASADLDWENLGGSYTFTEIDPTEWDEVSLSVSAGFSGGATNGQVDMSASRTVSADMGEGMVGPVLRW